jgi:hypothetical protein
MAYLTVLPFSKILDQLVRGLNNMVADNGRPSSLTECLWPPSSYLLVLAAMKDYMFPVPSLHHSSPFTGTGTDVK